MPEILFTTERPFHGRDAHRGFRSIERFEYCRHASPLAPGNMLRARQASLLACRFTEKPDASLALVDPSLEEARRGHVAMGDHIVRVSDMSAMAVTPRSVVSVDTASLSRGIVAGTRLTLVAAPV